MLDYFNMSRRRVVFHPAINRNEFEGRNMKNRDQIFSKHLAMINKIVACIRSCKTEAQLENAARMIYNNYYTLRDGPANYVFISILDLPIKQSKEIKKL